MIWKMRRGFCLLLVAVMAVMESSSTLSGAVVYAEAIESPETSEGIQEPFTDKETNPVDEDKENMNGEALAEDKSNEGQEESAEQQEFIYEETSRTDGNGVQISGYAITEYKGSEEEITIPSEIGGVPVLSVRSLRNRTVKVVHLESCHEFAGDEGGFDDCTALERIEIPEDNPYVQDDDGVVYSRAEELLLYPRARTQESYTVVEGTKKIADYAFLHAEKLTTVVFPRTLTEIGESAMSFSGVVSLNLSFDQNCILGEYWIEGCEKLESIIFGNGITEASIPENAYWNCLKEITIGKDVTKISVADSESLYNMPGSLEAVHVDENNEFYKSIDGVLYSKDGGTLYKIPAGNPIQVYNMPDTVTEVGSYAAEGNSYITDIVCGSNLRKIGSYAFRNCVCIRLISLNETLRTVEEEAFNGLFGELDYSEVEIPRSVSMIGENAFTSCTIYGYSGTEAEDYAVRSHLTFVSLDRDMSQTVPQPSQDGISVWDGNASSETVPAESSPDIYTINTAAELKWVADEVNSGRKFVGKTVLLNTDIDMQGFTWAPIGTQDNPFRGNFDGQNHVISNLVLDAGQYENAGLFGYVNAVKSTESYFKDVTFLNVKATGVNTGGVLAGTIYTNNNSSVTISNISSDGIFTGYTMGGIIGYIGNSGRNAAVTIRDCHAVMNMTGAGQKNAFDTGGGRMGGIAGIISSGSGGENSGKCKCENKVLIKNCTFSGTMNAKGRYCAGGGMVCRITSGRGKGKVVIEGCTASGSNNSGSSVSSGGILGNGAGTDNSEVMIKSCVNKMSVNGGYYAGGIVGKAGADITIQECCNEGYAVSNETGGNFGGICGELGAGARIEDSVNIGRIGRTNFGYSGGICGMQYGTIRRSYNLGSTPQTANTTTGISAPGAFAAMKGAEGKTEYSYFSLDKLPVQYLYGKDFVENPAVSIDRTVQNSTDGSIVLSGGISSGDFSNPGMLRTWDFASVWTYDQKFSADFPIPVSIRNLVTKYEGSKKSPASGSSKGTNHFYLTVVDRRGDAVRGAKVCFGADSLETNDSGTVQYEKKKLPAKMSVSAEGFITYTVDEFQVPSKTGEFKVYLKRTEEAGQYDLKSALLSYNGEYTELLAGTKQINIFKKDTGMTISCQPAFENAGISKYAIFQGTKEIKTSTDGKFQLKNGDFTVQDNSEDQVYVLVYDTEGNAVSKTLLNLYVIDTKSVDEIEIPIGKAMKYKVKNSYEFFNGEELSFRDARLPVSVVVTSDSWKVGVNMKKSVLESALDQDKKTLQYIGKNLGQNVDSGLFDKYKVHPEITLGDNPKIKLSLMGYAEGKLPYDNKINVKVTGTMSMEGKMKNQVKVFAVGLNIQGKVQADGTVTLTAGRNNWGAKLNRTAITLETKVDAYSGVGIADAALVGFYGDFDIVLDYILSPQSVAGPERMHGRGALGMIAHMGNEPKKFPIVEGEKDIYNRDADTKALESAGNENGQAKISSEDSVQVTGNTSVSLRPYVMQVGSDKVMVYENKDTSRAEADQETVMFSVYNKKNGAWDTPAAVADDNTADMNPQICSDGTNGYVIWNNAKGSLAECSSIEERAAKTDLCIAKYDTETHTFTDVQTIETNDYYEARAKLSVKSGNPVVAWTKNSAQDIWGFTGTNQIYMAMQNGGQWEVTEVVSQAEPLNSDAIGNINENQYYAYIDQSGTLILYNTDTKETKTAAETNAATVRFLTIDGTEAMLWTDRDGNVYLMKDTAGESEQIMDGFSGKISDIISDGDSNLALLYTRNGDNCADGYVRYYDTGTGTWSEEIQILTDKNYIDQMSGIYENGTLDISYNQRRVTVDGENVTESNELKYAKINRQKADLLLSDLNYNPYEVQAGEKLSVRFTVKNRGSNPCNDLKLVVNDGETNVLEKALEFSLTGGGESSGEAELLLPAEMCKKEYTFTVTDAGTDCSSMRENSKKINIGEARFDMDAQLYRIEGNYSTVTTVENTGYDSASGSVIVYDGKNEARIYEQYQFTELQPEETISFTTELQGKMDAKGNQKIGVKVVGDDSLPVREESTTLMAYQEDSVSVTDVQLEESLIELEKIGDTAVLHASVLPENAEDKQLLYRSSNPHVVSVSEDGTVTGVRLGTARITVSSADRKNYRTCVVKVGRIILVEKVELSDVQLSLKPGESKTITAAVFPAEADQEITWKSSDESVARVSEDGTITACGIGTAVITANASGVKAQCTVTVTENGEPGNGDEPGGGDEPGNDETVIERAVEVKNVSQLSTGGSYEPNMDKVWKYQWNGAKSIDITFSALTNVEKDNDYIYIYDKNGEAVGVYTGDELAGKTVTVPGDTFYIRLVSDGSQESYGFEVEKLTDESGKVITAKPGEGGGNQPGNGDGSGNGKPGNGNGVAGTKRIKVSRITIKGVSKKIAAGKKIQLSVSILPANASNKGVKWSSSNQKFAKVDAKGKVTLLKKSAGKSVTITATAKDGSKVKAVYKIKSMKGVVKSIKISGKKNVKAGKKLKLKAIVKASKGANKKIQWKSSNKKYATVSSSGNVMAKKAGKGKKVKITAMATDGSGRKKTAVIRIK